MSDDLFGHLYSTPALTAATGSRAWLSALLSAEAALARACARAGLVPAAAAGAIAACCEADRFDAASIAARAAQSASVVVPLVADLRAMVPAAARGYVHLGATSQDITDTAMSLVAARALDLIGADVRAVAGTLADLADRHRHTAQIGRTLLQWAAPTTFGLVAAGWLSGVAEAGAAVDRVRRQRLAAQLGGPVGTLAAFGTAGPAVADAFAAEVGLAAPALPWHTNRVRVAELAGALGALAGALGGIALDVELLSSSEVGELAEGSPGGSSAMPHKRNPARAVLVTACAQRVPGLVATILSAMAQEQQRAAGRWQAEWGTMTGLLRLCGAAAAHSRVMLAGLRVDTGRMRANLNQALAAIAVAGGEPATAGGQPVSAGGQRVPPATAAPGGGTDSAAALIDRALAAYRPAT